MSTDDKAFSIWPFNDPEFEGDAVSVLIEQFADELDVDRVGFDAVALAGLVSDKGDDRTLLEVDALSSAERIGRVMHSHSWPKEWSVAAGFAFGASFALWRMEQAGLFRDAGARQWIRDQQASGARDRPKPRWHDMAWDRAVEGWTSAPDKTPTALADEIHAWLHDPATWAPLKPVSPPDRADTVRRFLVRKGGATAARREVLQDGPELPDDADT